MSGSVDLGGRRIIKKIFFKQKTAYEIVTGDWSSDVCSSDLEGLDPIVMRLGAAVHSLPPPVADQALADLGTLAVRSEERRVGKECER